MEVQHSTTPNGGKFYIAVDGNELAEMTYVNTGPGNIIIDHTGVDDVLAGKGAGKQMVAAGVEWARKENIKIIPLCPFAKAIFEKIPAYADVLRK